MASLRVGIEPSDRVPAPVHATTGFPFTEIGTNLAAPPQALGADFAYLGIRFAATEESWADERYRARLIGQQMSDVVITDRISGLNATFLRGSITQSGLDPKNLPPLLGPYKPDLPTGVRAWYNVWSGGQGGGLIDDSPPAGRLISHLKSEHLEALEDVRQSRSGA